jgi:hypothetical protein
MDMDETTRLTRQAALELMRDGRRPTVAAVRARTRRGSAGTIAAVLSELFVELGRYGLEHGTAPWPHDVPPAVIVATQRLWATALEEAVRQYGAAQAQSPASTDERLASAQAEVARLRMLLDQANSARLAHEAQLQRLARRLGRLQKRGVVARTRLAPARRRRKTRRRRGRRR